MGLVNIIFGMATIVGFVINPILGVGGIVLLIIINKTDAPAMAAIESAAPSDGCGLLAALSIALPAPLIALVLLILFYISQS